ncbi:discoidin domain-containing protein [Lachnoclostridium sp.]|uniref:discoidin domain-containing protein n=1 Tax=Lachnoclostridium sp. TaxID=2028282 RepID=UPI002897AB9D|nr:discoidin domain-containing protein [Lachnoclostridium sp.]
MKIKIKRAIVLFGLMVCFMITIVACGKGKSEDVKFVDIVNEVGNMLTLHALDQLQAPIVNDSGMSGTGGRIHLHTNKDGDMYKGDEKLFVFDIGHIEKLGKLYIWNYNSTTDVNSGLQEIKVSFSEDNEVYYEPISYTLAKAPGEDSIKATNLVDGSVIDFEGVSGRYIKIEAVSNYDGDGYGLSEIRLFRYKQPIIEGESIACTPLERYINNKWSAKPEHYNFLNGTGLSDFRAENATHDNNPNHMYAQDASEFNFTVDLKGQYPISKIVLWNYNDKESLDCGLEKFRLKISDDNTTWKAIGTYTVDKGDGSEALSPSLTIEFDETLRGRYLQLEILSNYGGDKVGLSEVSVFLGSGWYCDTEPDYSALLSNYEGWTGADGVYTVNLDGKDYDYDRDLAEQKTFFIFSDTIVSDVDPISKTRSNVSMPNNTSAILTGKEADSSNIIFKFPTKEERTANIVPSKLIPATKPGKHIYYWLGDTFVIGESLYVYSLRIDSVNTMYGFEQIGVDLAKYHIKDGEVDYDSLEIIDDGAMNLCNVSDPNAKWYFGGGVYQSTEDAGGINPDGYVYVYGYQDVINLGRELIVARVKSENIEKFSEYEYLNSNDEWVSEPPSEFKYLAHDVAPELSITQIQDGEYKGQYVLVNTHITNTATIKASIAKNPYDVFENKTTIFTHDDCLTTIGEGNNTYNAKAHPALSGKNELIISYNINGNDCFEYADIYRPRFLRLAMVGSRK